MNKWKKPQPDTWDAHIKKASSSPAFAKEYKRSNYVLNTHTVMAERIRNGEPVGEMYLTGRLKQELLDLTDLTEDDFQKYNR
jgi:hypothetical protein